jgi:hypothetical protein
MGDKPESPYHTFHTERTVPQPGVCYPIRRTSCDMSVAVERHTVDAVMRVLR